VKMLIAGREAGADGPIDVTNPFDGSMLGTVPTASPPEIEEALRAAGRGAEVMADLSRRERARILSDVSSELRRRAGDLSRLLACETGKTLREAASEIDRASETFSLAAGEALRLAGEVVPFDAAPKGGNRFGFFLRVPLGVVVAITPFNFPVNLAAHKIAPAIAAGNAVILKPASSAPLCALSLGRMLYDAGLPPEALSVLTGSGSDVGDVLVGDSRPRMVTFTGSADVGRAIAGRAGLKKTAMELGSNSALIVTRHCDVEAAAERAARAAFALAGQVCISLQRVLVDSRVRDPFVDRLVSVTRSLTVGNQLLDGTDVGPMIDETQSARAERWLAEADSARAAVLCGGERSGTLFSPTVVGEPPEDARIWTDEVFAPIVSVREYDTLDEAIDGVNASRYGLQAGIYTDRLEEALEAAHRIRCGGVMVNDVPTFRVDLMPYGGEKESGAGREGPRFAIEEMTEIRVVGVRRSGGFCA